MGHQRDGEPLENYRRCRCEPLFGTQRSRLIRRPKKRRIAAQSAALDGGNVGQEGSRCAGPSGFPAVPRVSLAGSPSPPRARARQRRPLVVSGVSRLHSSSGSLAMLAAMRRASSRVSSAPRLFLAIDVAERLPVSVADDETGGDFLNGPGRREVARHIVFCYYQNRLRRAALLTRCVAASGGRVSGRAPGRCAIH